MHLSHPVRRMRDDPFDDKVAAPCVEPADDDVRAALESRVKPLGGSLECELQSSGIAVSLAEPAISDPCELDGIERIETVDTLGY